MRRHLAPMLASPAGELPTLAGWMVEPKFDGFRVLAELRARDVHLWSRNDIDKAAQFPEVREQLAKLAADKGPMVLDGELVAIDRKGAVLRFQELQQRHQSTRSRDGRSLRDTRTAFVVFDVLFLGRRDVRGLPLRERRTLLASLVKSSTRAVVRRGESFRCGTAGAGRLLAEAEHSRWEGLMLKHVDSPYVSGERSPLWRKVKLEHEQEFVIGGYTLPTEGAERTDFGALLVGHYDDDGALRYAGKVGTGFTQHTLTTLGKQLTRLARVTPPFVDAPNHDRTIWVKPRLVAQIRYNEMTESGFLRQPAFLGLRDDKDASEVRLEAETSKAAILDTLRCAT
jgi:bifunctional non-homologous end joining protein LigD